MDCLTSLVMDRMLEETSADRTACTQSVMGGCSPRLTARLDAGERLATGILRRMGREVAAAGAASTASDPPSAVHGCGMAAPKWWLVGRGARIAPAATRST